MAKTDQMDSVILLKILLKVSLNTNNLIATTHSWLSWQLTYPHCCFLYFSAIVFIICIYLFLQDDWQSKIWGSTATTHSWLSWQFWSNTSCVVICNQIYFIWIYYYNIIRGRHGRDRMMQSLPITTDVSSNPASGEVIKFVCDVGQDGGFLHQ